MQRKIKKPHDLWAGVLFLAVGVAVAWYNSYYSLGTLRRMGPGFLPVLLGILLSGIALLIILRGLVGQVEKMKPFTYESLRIAFTVLMGMLAFGLLIRPAGLIVAILVMVLLCTSAMRGYGWRAACLTAAVLAVGSALVFVVLLGQPIPLFGKLLG